MASGVHRFGVFFEPFRPSFSPPFGLPSSPMETFLRMLFFKCRYRFGFEAFCQEVTDSVSWSRFCRIPLGGSVPDHSTLNKVVKRCGPPAVEALNRALLAKVADNKLLKTDRVRSDTTRSGRRGHQEVVSYRDYRCLVGRSRTT